MGPVVDIVSQPEERRFALSITAARMRKASRLCYSRNIRGSDCFFKFTCLMLSVLTFSLHFADRAEVVNYQNPPGRTSGLSAN